MTSMEDPGIKWVEITREKFNYYCYWPYAKLGIGIFKGHKKDPGEEYEVYVDNVLTLRQTTPFSKDTRYFVNYEHLSKFIDSM